MSRFHRSINYSIFRFLHYVFAVCEHGSFHRAALALGVEASALSRRIHDIEAALGFEIFTRCHNGVLLTEPGGGWVDEIRPHYEALRDKTAVASSGANEKTVLNIGVSAPLGSGDIVAFLHRAGEDHAPISSALADGPCSTLRLAVLRRQLDVAFVWDCCSDKGWRIRDRRDEALQHRDDQLSRFDDLLSHPLPQDFGTGDERGCGCCIVICATKRYSSVQEAAHGNQS